MNYIVLDLEWNQSFRGKEYTVLGLPFEIIQIGAVKLDENKKVIGKWERIIKPVVYTRLHGKVSEMLGITADDFKSGQDFKSAASEFLEWCGEDYKFITWGGSDLTELCILGYLWFNASPSKLLMGDAGSRAIGIFIAFSFLKLHCPLLFIPLAIILIVDGGLGLIKVSFIRFLHINLMQNIRTPIHDHMRKNKVWSDAQVVFGFAIIQIVIAAAIIFAVM